MAANGRGYIDPNIPNPMGPHDATIIIYGYTPSLALAALAIALFVLAFVAHLALLIRHRTWYFIPLTVGIFMEIIGYIFRLLSSQQDPYSVPWFVVQYFFIVVAPVLFSAAIYTLVSVLISIYGRECAPLPPKAILGIFISCDVVATIIQVAGAALIGVKESNRQDPTTANNILLAGLAFQVFSSTIFAGMLTLTLLRARRSPATVSRLFLAAYIVASLAVYLRTCYRLAETTQGVMGHLSTHEVYFGCLEFAPIVVSVYIFIYWHPGRWLHRSANADKHGSDQEIHMS